MSRLTTKSTKWHVRPAKARNSLGFRPVWSETSLSAWRKLLFLATHWVGECPDWSESSLGAKLFWWFCHEAAQIIHNYMNLL